jgi:hypothetical protein
MPIGFRACFLDQFVNAGGALAPVGISADLDFPVAFNVFSGKI